MEYTSAARGKLHGKRASLPVQLTLRLCRSFWFIQPPAGVAKAIKGKVKKSGWNFSTFAAHLIEQELF